MRRRAQSYRTIDGITRDRDDVPWYWRILAIGTSFVILGGYLMLPVTFDSNAQSRISKPALGIFAVALLTAGFSFTALLCFAVRNPLFQADAVFLPSLTSCLVGLLTVFYDFLTSARYVWNVPALLVTIAAAVTTVIYGGLLVYTQRRITIVKARGPAMPLQVHRPGSLGSSAGPWQEQTYYENYNRNMFPTSIREPQPQPQPVGHDPNQITEEEMQRQQMLMLLLHREQPPTPDPSQSTFHIDWQGQEQEDSPPTNGWYAPQLQTAYSAHPPQSAYPETAYPAPSPGISRQWTGDLRPWDGVWRGPPPQVGRVSSSIQQWDHAGSREERRQEIERGMR
ncbi:hypothetical protein LTR56_015210 [Elasticomyces elasticus]|nr:hypothetical protein LTR56_015210 [Elasticomyces elasticus]KAK3644504.1 hypothetical protein LTR22_015224 [Elasticomyces elasticus]KAK4915541.1 hypothetical protein LTR49_016388 [Elasticomyces elasticus]KAK5756258.1 hypothetical protein LTS12_013682 [Elasticomyces elasticus]